MQTIYCEYQAGINDGQVYIRLGIDEKRIKGDMKLGFLEETEVSHKKHPRELIAELEELIVRNSGEEPHFCSTYDGNELHSNTPRTIRFFTNAPNFLLGEDEDPEKVKEINERNATRHERVYPVYQEFIKGLQQQTS